MRDNLIFSGIPEADNFAEEGEDCEEVIQHCIESQMKLAGTFHFDRVHRLGKFNSQASYPRPIVAKFTYHKQKEYVRQKAPSALMNTDFFVREQFPVEIENRRKQLYPIAKQARKVRNNTVKLVRDKLYINDRQYHDGDEIPGVQNTEQEHTYTERRNTQQTQSGKQTIPGIQNTERERTYTARRNTQQANPGKQIRYNQHRQISGAANNTQWSRTFTRTQPSQRYENSSQIPLSNMFANLEQENTPKREPLAGKTKARSPLENSDSFKKQKDDNFITLDETRTSPNNSNMDTLQESKDISDTEITVTGQ
jgi:hypothetical protein